MVSLVHAAAGYAATNGIVLNFLISCAVLTLFYLTTVDWLPKPYGWLAVLLAAGAPIYMINVTSSGFESLNLLFVLIYFLFLLEVVRSDGQANKVELLLLTTLLLGQCRYESAIFILMAPALLLPVLIRSGFFRRMSYLSCIMPVFLIPFVWQRRLFMGISELNKLGHESYEVAGSAFSLTIFSFYSG